MKYFNYLILLIALLSLLYLSPTLDRYFAPLPYDYTNNSFYGEIHLWCKLIYYSVDFFSVCIIILPLIFLFLAHRKYKFSINFAKRFALITYISLLIGPGIIVNSGFKTHWGRARPYQVIRDYQIFSPFWQYTANKPANNSFPSGHASIGFFLGIPLLATRYKKLALLISLTSGFIVGLVRILQGGHYFSDIVLSGIIVIFVGILAEQIVNKYIIKVGNE